MRVRQKIGTERETERAPSMVMPVTPMIESRGADRIW